MNYEALLQKGQSRTGTTSIVNHVGVEPERFHTLMQVMLKGEEKLLQRASWPASEIAAQHPFLLKPYYGKIMSLMEDGKTAAPFKRHFLRVFSLHGVPEKWEGRLINTCFNLIPSEQQAIAVRAFSITVAALICKKHPALKRELVVILETVLEMPVSAAVQVRIKRAIKDVKSDAASV